MTTEQLYTAMIRIFYSYLEERRESLAFANNMKVSEFHSLSANEAICLVIHRVILERWNYEISYNQMEIAISLFMKNNTNLA